MFSALLIGQEGWYSKRCKLTWKLKGTKSNRMYFQLYPSTLPIEETEFGLLPMPKAWDGDGGGARPVNNGKTTFGSPGVKDLAVARLLPTPTAIQREHPERVEALQETGATSMFSRANGEARPNSIIDHLQFHGMLPTPTATGADRNTNYAQGGTCLKNGLMNQGLLPTPRGMVGDAYADNSPNSHLRHTPNLATLASKGMLPTPIAGDWKGQLRSDGTANMLSGKMALLQKEGLLPTPSAFDWNTAQTQEKHQERKQMQKENGINLHYPLKQMVMDINPNGKTSQLSPQFVMEMMGFPTDWTLLPFLSGETNQSKAVETP